MPLMAWLSKNRPIPPTALPNPTKAISITVMSLLLSGCGEWRYYQQAVHGHFAVQSQSRPVEAWLQRPDTDPHLRERLQRSQQIRDFATTALHLPDNSSYRQYADLERPFLVKNIFAAKPLSLTPKQWCYPIIGCASYRGFFDESMAAEAAHALHIAGYDVFVGKVPAYSSLGYFADPLLNTFIFWPVGLLAELLFHELAHQKIYVADDSAFNEGFATFVGEQGAAQWLAAFGTPAEQAAYAQFNRYREEFHALIAETKTQLAELYATDHSDAQKLQQKQALLAELRQRYRQQRDTAWAGYSGFDGWMEQDLNNAKFIAFQTYREFVPYFAALFRLEDGHWEAFYAAVQRLTHLPAPERWQSLKALQN